MSGVAYNGSSVSQSTKSGHVTYNIEHWEKVRDGYYDYYDEDGVGHGWNEPKYDWVNAGSGSTDALIASGAVQASSPNVFVNGKPIATDGDSVPESWVASPAVPTSNSSTRYTPSGATSGGGSGQVSELSSKVYANGKRVAKVGTKVNTMLSTQAEITSGSNNVFLN